MIELRRLRYFLAVAEEGSFTRAAHRLNIGQPPLSQQIKLLEGEVGATLFRRLPHGAELTDAGRAFHDGVVAVPGVVTEAARAARRAAGGETGLLRVGFTGSAAFNRVVPATIRGFRRRYPDVEIILIDNNSVGLVSALADGVLDAAFLRPASISADDLMIEAIDEEPLVLVLPEDHPALSTVREGRVALEQVRTSPFITVPRASGQALFDAGLAACRAAGFEPLIGQTAPHIGAILSLVAADLGVALAPASVEDLRVPGTVVVRPEPEAPLTALALCCRRGDASPLLRHFIAEARRHARSAVSAPRQP